jgi:hypothetical protein
MRAFETALTDLVDQVYQPLPIVACSVPEISVFCVPSQLEENGLDFSKVCFVMFRELNSGGHDVKCSCDRSSDLAMTISALSGIKNPLTHGDSEHSPSYSDLCQHSRALLYYCLRLAAKDWEIPFNDEWWSDPRQLNCLMTFAARAVHDAEETFEYMAIDDTPVASSTCRKLPYKCATTIYEVVLDSEVLWRHHRSQASIIPGSIVIAVQQETVKCATCPRHTKCRCVALVEKLLHIQKEAKEYNTNVKVHENGMSLSICGRSVTPISPFCHPNVVRKRTYTDGTDIPEDAWREAAARRFRSNGALGEAGAGSNGYEDWSDPQPDGESWILELVRPQAIVLHSGSCWLVNVYAWRNTATRKLQPFDGHSHGVINASDSELFTFEFLRHFLRGILNCSQSFRGYLEAALDAWQKGSADNMETDPALFQRVNEYSKKLESAESRDDE